MRRGKSVRGPLGLCYLGWYSGVIRRNPGASENGELTYTRRAGQIEGKTHRTVELENGTLVRGARDSNGSHITTTNSASLPSSWPE